MYYLKIKYHCLSAKNLDVNVEVTLEKHSEWE